MNRKRIRILLIFALSSISLYLVFVKTKSTFGKEITDFAVKDTSSIVKIFMANKGPDRTTLERDKQGGVWTVNGQYKARLDMVNTLLETICDVDVVAPVAKHAYNNVIKMMAASSTKIEIYTKSYRIKLFNKIFLFPYIKLEKVYYVGVPTQDKQGTLMLIEGSKVPCITFIPGFNGFLSTRYSAHSSDWRDRSVFSYLVGDIKSVIIKPQDQNESFEIDNVGVRKYQLKSLSTNQNIAVDSLKIFDYLTSFYQLNFEYFTDAMNKVEVDSIKKSKPHYEIIITDINGKTNTIKTFIRKAPIGYVDVLGYPRAYDMDRLYALINNGKDFVIIQYFVFDRIFKKLSDFTSNKKNEKELIKLTKK